MFKYLKFSLLSVTLLSSSMLLADGCTMSPECSTTPCMTTVSKDMPDPMDQREDTMCMGMGACPRSACEDTAKMGRMARLKANVKTALKPGQILKGIESASEKVFGKDTFNDKFASGMAFVLLKFYFTKVVVDKLFDTLTIKNNITFNTDNSVTWGYKTGSLAATEYGKKYLGEPGKLTQLGDIVNNHRVKDVTGLFVGMLFTIMTTGKNH